jgi:hypothetical protein
MHLAGPDGSFDLTLLGYQFPELAAEPYDSNWLQVRAAVRHPRGSWTATDPCLLTYEAARLAEWLDAVAVGAAADAELSFLEPCLGFELREGSGGACVLRVYFQYEFRPPWAVGLHDEAAVLDVSADADALRGAASALRAQLRAFPQRTER